MIVYRIAGLIVLALLLLAAEWLVERARVRAGAEAWRNMRAGVRWDSHFLERDTVRLLAMRNHPRR